MKRALILSAVLVIALMALTLPEAAFPETAEAQTPPAQIPKPTIKIRANGKIGVNWDPVPGAIFYASHFESNKGTRRTFVSHYLTYGFVNHRYLEDGSRYRARLVAKNAAGLWSEWSEWSDWTSPYGAPAQIPKPTIKIRASGKIGVNWDPVDGAVYYGSHFESDKGVRYTLGSRYRTFGFVSPRNLEVGSRYRARVVAKSASGVWGEWSEWSDWTSPYGRVLSK